MADVATTTFKFARDGVQAFPGTGILSGAGTTKAEADAQILTQINTIANAANAEADKANVAKAAFLAT